MKTTTDAKEPHPNDVFKLNYRGAAFVFVAIMVFDASILEPIPAYESDCLETSVGSHVGIQPPRVNTA